MRKQLLIPRIIKINSIDQGTFLLTFNNGELRKIHFPDLLSSLGYSESSFTKPLFLDDYLKEAKLRNHTLSFDQVEQYIEGKDGQRQRVPFEIGADVLYNHSSPLPQQHIEHIAQIVRQARISAGLTQRELAERSGTSRTYISRIENRRSDIELTTLKKIVEVGLGKELRISIR